MIGQRPNAETINDRVKLLFHRLVARQLGADPSLIDQARAELARQRERYGGRDCYAEWENLLRLDVPALRREIIHRNERMTSLRSSSPFAFIIDVRNPAMRKRVWRIARKAIESNGRPRP